MKGDFTRSTYKKTKHYRKVKMQQGRVQVDADWNEQVDIQAHLDETTNIDVIGSVGAPIGDAGFGIALLGPPTNDFALSPGRLYVDGILCEVDGEWTTGTVTGGSVVNIQTATLDGRVVDAPQWVVIQGAGQTAQATVQSIAVGAAALTPVGVDVTLTAPLPAAFVTGTTVRVQRLTTYLTQPDFPVVPPPGNVLGGATTFVAYLDVWLRHLTAVDRPFLRERALQGPDTATRDKVVWQVRLSPQTAPVACANWSPPATPDSRLRARAQPAVGATSCSVASGGGYLRLENQLYRVEIAHGSDVAPGAETFIWSRDNASMVARLKALDNVAQIVTVDTAGPDDVLGFAPDQYVEVSDEERTLLGQRGVLAKVTNVAGTELTVVWPTAAGTPAMAMSSFGTNPTVRRWDANEQPVQQGTWVTLEDGVQVELIGATFRTGDYWLIPARTIGGCVEWPTTGPSKEAVFRPPYGIVHHYYPLAVIANPGGEGWQVNPTCVPTFPPLTGMVEMYYVGGDGQECLPGNALPEPLEVGVDNWQTPVAGASVRFTILVGGGLLNGAAVPSVVVATDATGVAACLWQPAPNIAEQRVEARFLDATATPVGTPIHFNANLSTADQVAYNPGACLGLEGVTTVQQAIDRNAHRARLDPLSGDGQMTSPGQNVPFPITVQVVSDCGPVTNATVIFDSTANGGNGLLGPVGGAPPSVTSLNVQTDGTGAAACVWQLDPSAAKPVQQVTASLGALPPPATGGSPSTFTFTATATPPSGAGCDVTIGAGGQFAEIADAMNALLAPNQQLCLCLLRGEHTLAQFKTVPGAHVTISGCGPGSVVNQTGLVVFDTFASVHLRDFAIQSPAVESGAQLRIQGGANFPTDVAIEGCTVSSPQSPVLTIGGAGRIRIVRSGFVSLQSWDKVIGGALVAFGNARSPSTIAEVLKRAAAQLLVMSTAQRADVVTRLEHLIPAAAPAERRAIMLAALAAIAHGATTSAAYASLLTNIVFGTAVVIADANAETDIEDNVIDGFLQLYGSGTPATRAELQKNLGTPVVDRTVVIHGSETTFVARGNRLLAIEVDATGVGITGGAVNGVFGRVIAADNTCAIQAALVGATVTVQGNEWRGNEPDGGCVAIGMQAVAVANTRGSSTGTLVLYALKGEAQAAANVPAALIP